MQERTDTNSSFVPVSGHSQADWKCPIVQVRRPALKSYSSCSCANYNMGFSSNCVAAKSNVTGEDRNGHERTGEDIFL